MRVYISAFVSSVLFDERQLFVEVLKVLKMTFELATMTGLGKGSAGNEDRQDIEAAVRSLV